MYCPRGCGIDLSRANRQGVEIDYCPKCQGIWLDRGELEKLISLSSQRVDHLMPPPGSHPGNPQGSPHRQDQRDYRGDRDQDYRRHDDDDDDYSIDKHGRRRRKREHWLGEMFDFFD